MAELKYRLSDKGKANRKKYSLLYGVIPKNKLKINQRSKEWYNRVKDNSEWKQSSNDRSNEWHDRNRGTVEYVTKRKKERKRYYINNKDKVKERNRIWRQNNPDKQRYITGNNWSRRKELLSTKGEHTLEEWLEVKRLCNYRCNECGVIKPLTEDHIIPLSKGGMDFIDNIQPLCKPCNSRKWSHYEVPNLLQL